MTKSTGNITLNDETVYALPLKLKTQQRYPLFSFLLNTWLEITESGIQKEIKIYRDWKERSKILLTKIKHECLQKTLRNLKISNYQNWVTLAGSQYTRSACKNLLYFYTKVRIFKIIIIRNKFYSRCERLLPWNL